METAAALAAVCDPTDTDQALCVYKVSQAHEWAAD